MSGICLEGASRIRVVLHARWWLISVILMVVGSGNLKADILQTGQNSRSVDVSGLERQFTVHVPRNYDSSKSTPLVLDFHGFYSSSEEQQQVSGFLTLAEREEFIVVFPQGYSGWKISESGSPGRTVPASWNGGALCCGPARDDGVDDVKFSREIVRVVAEEANIDSQRIYATGISNGGAMAGRLGCEAADLFAAVAPVAFPIPLVPMRKCQPGRPIPIITFAGLTDTMVPYEGGEVLGVFVSSAQESIRHWQTVNGCNVESLVETHNVGSSSCQTATSCDRDVQVSFCSLKASQIGPAPGHNLYLNPDIHIASVAWSFLSRFYLPNGDAL